MYVVVSIVVDVSLGRVTVDFSFKIFVIVVVEMDGFTVVFKVIVLMSVIFSVDPAIVVVEVFVSTGLVWVIDVDIVLVIVMNEVPEDTVLVKVFVTVVVTVAVPADAADPWPSCASVTTSVKNEVEPEAVTVDVATNIVTVDGRGKVVVIAGAVTRLIPVRLPLFKLIQVNVVMDRLVEIADNVVVEVTTKSFAFNVVVGLVWAFTVMVRVAVEGGGRNVWA